MTATKSIRKGERPLAALFGLTGDPKAPGETSRYFFESPLIAQQLTILRKMTENSGSITLVMGERGSGKSTLIQRLVSSMPGKWRAGRLKVTPRGGISKDRWKNLHNRMVFMAGRNGPRSIILDDAHQLTKSELRMLMRCVFANGKNRKFRNIVLFAEPALRASLRKITHGLPTESAIDKIHISPFTEQQTADYLKHRIQTAGRLDRLPFSKKQIKAIYSLSGGLPGWINGEAFMLLKRMKSRRSIRHQVKQAVTIFHRGKKNTGDRLNPEQPLGFFCRQPSGA
jgi:general secretion pathway protein A